MNTISIISQIIGWIYWFAWSFSFYGQIYVNYKKKSVQGCKLDFVILNFTGFLFYSIYTTVGYFTDNPEKSGTGDVSIQDVVFAYHACILTIVTLLQTFIYPVKKKKLQISYFLLIKRGNNQVNNITIFSIVSIWTFALTYGSLNGTVFQANGKVSLVSFLGYFKVGITFFKYCPQVYWNYVRKCTEGWSIFNILMDATGAIFSFLQNVVDAIGQGKNPISGGTLNVVKYALSLISFLFDIIFIIQHYILYRKKTTQNNEQISLQQQLKQQEVED
ncbi:pq loop repeat family protein [Ichthyophthirius multifiliis]|uniref:Pq loop repeat family protein n=1 Tax=Ichthyophthirius multifiliis TaxID=5932 RepID=G0R1B7_ICHMU|nr:pq loop repeat family protein [Ichthyophthirius multifiliis]EGR28750.1 pq loop repeat family protein [Ichthyophthirius multifiliis]|eukprot:XP_004029986.1 pq loop repeat family protein [Ichthyophthirius multifiliis]